MEVDTGASTSLINHKTLASIQDENTKMEPTCSRIRTYTGEIMKPNGCANIQLEYNGQKTKETVIIVDGNYSNLLGRDILRKIRLNWNELLKVNQVKEHFVDNVQLNDILIQYKNVFNSDLGTLKNVEINL